MRLTRETVGATVNRLMQQQGLTYLEALGRAQVTPAARVLAQDGAVGPTAKASAVRAVDLRARTGAPLADAQVVALREASVVDPHPRDIHVEPNSCWNSEMRKARKYAVALGDRGPGLTRPARIAVVGMRLQRDGVPRDTSFSLAAAAIDEVARR